VWHVLPLGMFIIQLRLGRDFATLLHSSRASDETPGKYKKRLWI